MADFPINDRRGMPRQANAANWDTTRRAALPYQDPNVDARRRQEARDYTYKAFEEAGRPLPGRRTTASTGAGAAGGLQLATGRPRDPMFYWQQNNIPFDFTRPGEMAKIRKFCRLLYMTHPIVSACVDIYSKLPLQGMHVETKDDQLTDFYNDLFMDQLGYEDHLVRMGRQYWLAGESFTLGGWNESLGVWEDEQLVNPDDVEIESSLFMNDPRFLMRLPEELRDMLTTRSPRWAFDQVVNQYPELLNYTGEDSLMPISNMIMHQMRFEADDYTNRGISILMRAFRSIIQEEMLNTAVDAIADRLYTPLIMVRLGASATDLGLDVPWIPTEAEKENFNAALDQALAADFRVMTTHFATEIENVFGRENVPDLTNDFDRLEGRIMMAFGLSQTMITGASAGETYAADALNRDVVTQLLTHYQRKLQQFFQERAAVVAEAQEHYDYEVRNNQRYLITEEIYEVDEETGEGRIVEKPKLLIPELKFKILNLTDESAQRDFVEQLAEAGVPISFRTRTQGIGVDFDDMIEQKQSETVALAVAEQETRKATYEALRDAGLPIPDDLKKDFLPQAMQAGGDNAVAGGSDVAIPTLGAEPQNLPVLAPVPGDPSQDDQQNQMDDDATNEETDPTPPGDEVPDEDATRPPESDEQRKRMPKAASKPIPKLGIRRVTYEHYVEPDNSGESNPEHFIPTGRFGKPKHVGMSRYVRIPDELKLPKE